jgi:hypothetical protein
MSTTTPTTNHTNIDRPENPRHAHASVARFLWFVVIRVVLIAAISLGATALIVAALHSSAVGDHSAGHGPDHHRTGHPDAGRLGAGAFHEPGAVSTEAVRLAAASTALPRQTPGSRLRTALAKSSCPGPAAYWDPSGTTGAGGQPGVAVALGPLGVAVDSTPPPGWGCGPRASKKNTDTCGCLVPTPGGWVPMPPPAQGGRSGYSVPGYTPNGYVPSGYVPSGYAPAGYPSAYAYSNSYPSRNYPSGYAPEGGYPSGFYPPNAGYAPTPGNPCANPSGYGPAGYPVIDSNGRLLCRVSATNIAPGAGANLTGW